MGPTLRSRKKQGSRVVTGLGTSANQPSKTDHNVIAATKRELLDVQAKAKVVRAEAKAVRAEKTALRAQKQAFRAQQNAFNTKQKELKAKQAELEAKQKALKLLEAKQDEAKTRHIHDIRDADAAQAIMGLYRQTPNNVQETTMAESNNVRETAMAKLKALPNFQLQPTLRPPLVDTPYPVWEKDMQLLRDATGREAVPKKMAVRVGKRKRNDAFLVCNKEGMLCTQVNGVSNKLPINLDGHHIGKRGRGNKVAHGIKTQSAEEILVCCGGEGEIVPEGRVIL